MNNNDYLKLDTPFGIASYPHLNTPDAYKGNLPAYKVQLRLDASLPEVITFRDKVEKYLANEKVKLREQLEGIIQAQPESKDPKMIKKLRDLNAQLDAMDTDFSSPLSEEFKDGLPTGNLILRIKTNSTYTRKNRDGSETIVSLRPKFFDAGANYLENPPEVKAGSIIRCSVTVRPFLAPGIASGASCKISSLQIKKLQTGEATTSFGEVDGYIADEDQPSGNGGGFAAVTDADSDY